MVRSMTAFARHPCETEQGTATWEVRSVNSRYLELPFRLPDDFRDLEPHLREHCKTLLSRGKVEIFLRFQTSGSAAGLSVDQALLQALKKASDEVQAVMPETPPADTLTVLQWPGVLIRRAPDYREVQETLLSAFTVTLQQLQLAREREGQALKSLIMERCQRVSALSHEADAIMPVALRAQRDSLQEKLSELRQSLDSERLEQEMLLLAQKADIAEESDRLRTHIREVMAILQRDEPIGRRLDFMMQELNREANTLSSKALHNDLTRIGVEIKVLIEQMREQVQNIE